MIDKRLLLLKFYADQKNLGVKNKLFTFRVDNIENAIRIIVRFEVEDIDTNIRAAFLNPNKAAYRDKGIRFVYHDHPLYKFLKGSD